MIFSTPTGILVHSLTV